MVGASSRPPSSGVGVVGGHSSALSWNPEAFNTLYHFVKCSQLEYVGQEGRSPIQELIYERPYMVLPPLMEWVRSGQLLHFYLSFFCIKSLVCLEGKSMTPHWENTILFRSSQQLPRLRLGPSTRLVRCFRNYRDTRTPSGVPH